MLVPARGDLDFTIDCTLAIADDEVIAALAVGLGKCLGCADGRMAVMNVDRLPSGGMGGGFGVEDDIERRARFVGDEIAGSVGCEGRALHRAEEDAGEG